MIQTKISVGYWTVLGNYGVLVRLLFGYTLTSRVIFSFIFGGLLGYVDIFYII